MTIPINIYPFKTGLDTDMEPWLLPDDAFTEINNIHIKHGYLEKRAGFIPFGTLSTADRVMGIYQHVDAGGGRTSLAFDQTRGFYFSSGSNSFLDLNGGAALFTAGVTNYIWGVNWQASTSVAGLNRLYFSNGLASNSGAAPTLDGIWYYDGTPTAVALQATLGPGRYMWGGKLLFTLGQRLVVLNTFEGTASASNFPQRARWCAKQNPGNWNDVTAGGGGFTDAATGDQIVSARALQNQIIVYFTDSIWQLVPTSDPNRAFRWQRINDFRACKGKMASVGYDRYVVALGDRGITACDGVQSRRVDNNIETFTNENINIDEFSKVFCARSFDTRRWWTLFPSQTSTECDSALAYDDESNSYSTYSISLNCLGYGNKGLDYTLNDFSVANNLDLSLDEMGEDTLQSYFWQENANVLLGGDTSGNIYVLESSSSDDGVAIESTFLTAAWNPFKDENKECKMPYIDFYVDTEASTVATVEFFKNTEENPYASSSMDFLPPLDFISSINNVSNSNPCSINSSDHGLSTGDIIYIYGVKGTKINSGEIGDAYTITRVDANNFTLDGIDSTSLGTYSGAGGVYVKQFYRTKTWKRVYAGGTGFQHRIRFTSSGIKEAFRIHAMKPMFKTTGKRLIN